MGRSDQRNAKTVAQPFMLTPDFSKYSLALFEEKRLIFSSTDAGLRPLFESLDRYAGKTGLILYDKVIGLAAAKLIVYTAIIAEVIAGVASVPAKKFLDNNIVISARHVVPNIMTRDRSAVCPGEVIALNTEDPADFIRQIKTMLDGQRK